MENCRDLEEERLALLALIEAALEQGIDVDVGETADRLNEPSVVLPKNNVGSEHANAR